MLFPILAIGYLIVCGFLACLPRNGCDLTPLSDSPLSAHFDCCLWNVRLDLVRVQSGTINASSELSMIVINTCYHLGVKLPPNEIENILATVDENSLIRHPWTYPVYEAWYVQNFREQFPKVLVEL